MKIIAKRLNNKLKSYNFSKCKKKKPRNDFFPLTLISKFKLKKYKETFEMK
jgi:hypothetical protein